MIELRWAVLENARGGRPVLQWRWTVKHPYGHMPDEWSEWSDVPTVVVTGSLITPPQPPQ